MPDSITATEVQTKVKYTGVASYDATIKILEAGGLCHVYTGKTRETFSNPEFPYALYILATDRISIFDVVLNTRVYMKGAVLTAMSIYWLKEVFSEFPNHLIAFGKAIQKYLPAEINKNSELQNYLMKHMIIVEKTEVLKVEAIVRGFLTGSGLESYKKDRTVCGITLPEGLIDGSMLTPALFTPSTKADYGSHDKNISFEEMVKIVGTKNANFIKNESLYLYDMAYSIARKTGIIIADTKFEWGVDRKGNLILVDEVLTPDSSRFWPKNKWCLAMDEGKTPPSFDKQPVRNAGKAAGVTKGNTSWVPAEGLLNETSLNYQKILALLVKKTLGKFWLEDMGIE